MFHVKHINTLLNRALALAGLLDAAIVAWWLVTRRKQRTCARTTWKRRGRAQMLGDGLITPDDLWEAE